MKKTFFKAVVLLRKIKLIVFLLCVLLGNMAFSCDDDNDSNNSGCAESYQTIKTLTDAIGRIGFDEINKQYTVNIYIEGTIDGMYTLYPCQLADEFKTVNQKVKIDGNLFTNDKLPKPQLGGQETFFVDIIKIAKVNN